jgi:glycosyltransferase involved in cell wall biosynthesis
MDHPHWRTPLPPKMNKLSHHQAELSLQKPPAPLPRVFLMTNTLQTGGSERQFVTLANTLDRNVFSVSLGCLRRWGPFLPQVENIVEFSPGGNLFKWKSQVTRLRLARYLRKLRVSVAHACDFYSNLMLIPVARLSGVPVVIGSHRQLGDLLTKNQFWAQAMVFRFCDRVVCNSQAATDRLRHAGVPEHKLCVIPNGIPDEVFAKTRPALEKEPGTVTVGMVSRMNDPIKQHAMFVRVAARLTARLPQLRFVLVGDGPLRPGLEALASELQVANRIRFLGDRRDIPAVLASLDISVLPSSSESLSNAILESMAVGLPVVASRTGGNPEIVGHDETGFLFDPGDEIQFAASLERLICEAELRRQFGLKARERALSSFRSSQMRDLYQDLYRKELIAKRRLPEPLEPLQVLANHP